MNCCSIYSKVAGVHSLYLEKQPAISFTYSLILRIRISSFREQYREVHNTVYMYNILEILILFVLLKLIKNRVEKH